MGMNLGIRTEDYSPVENHEWLASKHGTDICDSITLNADAFLATFADGIVPSGVVLGKVTATGLYVPYDDTAVDGSELARGHLFTTVDLGGTTAGTVDRIAAALYWHGSVVEAKLPVGHGLDAAAKVDLAQVRYV